MSHPYRVCRAFIVTTALVSLAGCGSEPAGTAPPASATTQSISSPSNALGPARLTIAIRQTAAATPVTHTLTCSPTGGTVQDPAAACAELAAAGGVKALRLDPSKMCTQQIAGPAQATITGTISGAKVNAKLAQSDGCRIAQWNSLSSLLGSRAGG